jgi:hypothetical protein
LDTIGDIKAEIGCIYRTAKSRRMAWHDATRASHILGVLARLIETGEIEERLAALERTLDAADEHERTNGHAPPPSTH